METLKGGGLPRSLSEHLMLQLLHRNHEELLSLAVSSGSECLLLLPQESQLKGFHIDQTFLETHILQGTPYGDTFVNFRGQEVEREGDELTTSLGFTTKVSVSILREEQMFAAGGPFTCLLISTPLLPSPAGRHADTAASSKALASSERKTYALKGAPQGPPGAPTSTPQELPFITATETQQRVETWWKQGPQGALSERLVHAEIAKFKATYVLVPGLEEAVAQRMRRLISACCRHLLPAVAETKEAPVLMERYVWLEVHDRLWPFFLETGEAKQAEFERGISLFRLSRLSYLQSLGLRRELQGTQTEEAAKELGKVPSMLLPHEKLRQLCLAVEAIHRACSAAVAAAAASSRGYIDLARKEAVEVCCEDLVALLVSSLADAGAGAFVASYLHMSVVLLQQPREARLNKEAFYLTALHSALTFLAQLKAPEPLHRPAPSLHTTIKS